jgi:hypothetical protein
MVRHLAIFVAVSFSLCATLALGADDITLTGREAAALRLAVDDFIRHRYSASGDLTHYTLKLRRTPKQAERRVHPGRGPSRSLSGRWHHLRTGRILHGHPEVDEDCEASVRAMITQPSNQAMQLTASKPAVYASVSAVVRVCCVACTEGSRQLILCLVRW